MALHGSNGVQCVLRRFSLPTEPLREAEAFRVWHEIPAFYPRSGWRAENRGVVVPIPFVEFSDAVNRSL